MITGVNPHKASNRIRVEFWDGNDFQLADWSITIPDSMPVEVFPGWLRNILSDPETYGIDIKELDR